MLCGGKEMERTLYTGGKQHDLVERDYDKGIIFSSGLNKLAYHLHYELKPGQTIEVLTIGCYKIINVQYDLYVVPSAAGNNLIKILKERNPRWEDVCNQTE
jgi:proteasome assembly chaperone (PAC2) family protein